MTDLISKEKYKVVLVHDSFCTLLIIKTYLLVFSSIFISLIKNSLCCYSKYIIDNLINKRSY